MITIKSIPSMTKAELIKEVARLATLVRSQSAAMTELGKLSDIQRVRIAQLTQALEKPVDSSITLSDWCDRIIATTPISQPQRKNRPRP